MDDQSLVAIKATGSSIKELHVGRTYCIADRSGTYSLVQFDSADSVVVREHGSGSLLTVDVQELKPLVASENTRNRDLMVIEEDRLAAAEAKLDAIRPLLTHRRVPRKLLEERATEVGQAPKTIRKWLRRYTSDPRLSSLGRKRRDDANVTRFDDQIEAAVKDALNALCVNGGLTLKQAHDDLDEEVKKLAKKFGWKDWRTPSYSTLYTRYTKLSEQTKLEARLGKRPARRIHGLQKGSLSDVDHPLALVQIDHLELPIVVVDEDQRLPIGKGWITVLIDVFSRCIAGIYITLEAPSNLSLGQAMCHAILPKKETLKLLEKEAQWPISGFMWTVHADNAGEFHGNMLELAAQEYDIELMYRKVREPQYGAYIESFLGTLSEKLRHAPGATREGPDSLGETDPNESAAMTLAELERYVLTLIVEYHNTPHSGLGGFTPLAKFSEGMRGGPGVLPIGMLRQPDNPEKLRIDFLPCDERAVHTKGIVWDRIWYSHDVLQKWVNSKDPTNIHEKRKFIVRRDPRDLSKIYFWDPDDEVYYVIGTRNLTRESITIWELNATRAHLKAAGKKTRDEDTIFAARAERKRIAAASKAKTESAQRKRAREAERDRLAKAGAEASQRSPTSTTPSSAESAPATTTEKSEIVGTAYTMDWGDA